MTKNGTKPFPDLLRFIPCDSLAKKIPCPYGKDCIFAHDKDELRKYGPRDKTNARILGYSVEGITFTATVWQRKHNCALVEGEDLDSDESLIGDNDYDMDAVNIVTASEAESDDEMSDNEDEGIDNSVMTQLQVTDANWLVKLPPSRHVKAFNAGGGGS